MKPLCVVLALSVTGCSFVFTRGPDEQPRTFPSCTSSMTWPIVDGVFTALFLTAMVSAIAEDEDTMSSSSNDDEATKAQKITSAALFAAVTGVSTYVGYRRVSRCRAARETFAAQYPNGMQPYGYPYGAYPGQYPPPYPGQQPQAYPPPYPGTQPAPTPAPAPTTTNTGAPTPTPQPVPTALGTEGDVCASSAECATGLTCTGNVCIRPPATK